MGFIKDFSRYGHGIYLHRFQWRIPNPQCSFDVSGSGKSVNERTGWSDTESIEYSCTLTYGTCENIGSLLFETHDNAESGNKYDDNSTMTPLIIEEEMDAMS